MLRPWHRSTGPKGACLPEDHCDSRDQPSVPSVLRCSSCIHRSRGVGFPCVTLSSGLKRSPPIGMAVEGRGGVSHPWDGGAIRSQTMSGAAEHLGAHGTVQVVERWPLAAMVVAGLRRDLGRWDHHVVSPDPGLGSIPSEVHSPGRSRLLALSRRISIRRAAG